MSRQLTYSYLHKEYVVKERSTHDIARELGTYPNRVRRALIENGIEPRDHAKAQATALKKGRSSHPVKGKGFSEDTKFKIARKVAEHWRRLDDAQYERRVEQGRAQWEKMDPGYKREMQAKAGVAIRKAAREGSKLERNIAVGLKAAGYDAGLHEEFLVPGGEAQHVDIYVPGEAVAIEIDGPTHFYPIWGEDRLVEQIAADRRKTGSLLAQRITVVRVKNVVKHVSPHMERNLLLELISLLEGLETGLEERGKLYHLEVGDGEGEE